MSAISFLPTRATHLRLVTDLFPGLQSLEMRDIIKTMAEKRLRRIRMDLEDRAGAIRLPVSLEGRLS